MYRVRGGTWEAKSGLRCTAGGGAPARLRRACVVQGEGGHLGGALELEVGGASVAAADTLVSSCSQPG